MTPDARAWLIVTWCALVVQAVINVMLIRMVIGQRRRIDVLFERWTS